MSLPPESQAPSIPRPEYPRPQLGRDRWLNLNGTWEFEVDPGDSGLERGLLERTLGSSIVVPFAPESEASGVGNTDFLRVVWYRRTVTVPADWGGARLLLHFGAVDHDTTVWVNGTEVGRHRGGFTSFTLDATDAVAPGEEAVIVVRARDLPEPVQARGKQSSAYANASCHYTRTTGIWQTVWLEPVPPAYVRRLVITPNLAGRCFDLTAVLSPHVASHRVRVSLSDTDGEVVSAEIDAGLDLSPRVHLPIPSDRVRTWSPSDPHLYDVVVELLDADQVADRVTSYAGLRSVAIDGHRILINGEPVFQRLVLDQGYWPETLMTAPSDQALVRDIELSLAAGFNGARLHQKVFEERYYFHADRLGYLVWGEFGDWGCAGHGPAHDHEQPTAAYVTQWLEALERDVNHPSIIGWCPLNETSQPIGDRITQLDDVTQAMYLATKLADPSRPVLDTSGHSHRVRGADVYDSHHYAQDPAVFAAEMGGLADGRAFVNAFDGLAVSVPYAGQPYFCSEFGGIWWNPAILDEPVDVSGGGDRSDSWGYGKPINTEAEFHARFEGLTRVLLDDPLMFGYCYTQLTDTFQEENGIYRFDRSEKLDVSRVRQAQQRVAAYEKA